LGLIFDSAIATLFIRQKAPHEIRLQSLLDNEVKIELLHLCSVKLRKRSFYTNRSQYSLADSCLIVKSVNHKKSQDISPLDSAVA
jgi:hypothetical protein